MQKKQRITNLKTRRAKTEKQDQKQNAILSAWDSLYRTPSQEAERRKQEEQHAAAILADVDRQAHRPPAASAEVIKGHIDNLPFHFPSFQADLFHLFRALCRDEFDAMKSELRLKKRFKENDLTAFFTWKNGTPWFNIHDRAFPALMILSSSGSTALSFTAELLRRYMEALQDQEAAAKGLEAEEQKGTEAEPAKEAVPEWITQAEKAGHIVFISDGKYELVHSIKDFFTYVLSEIERNQLPRHDYFVKHFFQSNGKPISKHTLKKYIPEIDSINTANGLY